MKSLAGMKVLDLTRFFAGPFCTTLLAELGAEVIKIEEPQGEGQRRIPPFIKGEALPFLLLHHNKKGVTLNLKHPRGKEIFLRLVEWGDVLVENYSPGTMDSLGLDYEKLSRVNPRLIYAAVSGFGHSGPYRSKGSFDPVAQAMGGMTALTGDPAGPPVKCGVAVGDLLGSLYATVAILAAWNHCLRTGEGQFIDISLQDAVWSVCAYEFYPRYLASGQVPSRTGNRHPNVAPYNCYRARDGYIVVGALTDLQWQALLRVTGREDLKDDPRFSTAQARVDRVAEVDSVVAGWVKEREISEVASLLDEAQVPNGAVLTLDRVVADPNLLAREMLLDVEHPTVGTLKMPGSVLKMSRTPGKVERGAPDLGEHNQEVYQGLLGLSREEVRSLKQEGAI